MIGIVCAAQIELSPFVKKYTDIFDRENVEYEIIHWDRSGEETKRPENVYTYTGTLSRYVSNFKKLLPFLGFSKFARKIIKARKYEKLVVLTTQTAVLIPLTILRKYKKRYFFDYRDTSYEYIGLYKKLVCKFADNAFAMCISSPGFKEYITTKTPMVIAHNFRTKNIASRSLEYKKRESGKIRLGYIGVLREYEYLKKIITQFGDDSRFEFAIHGSGDDVDRLKEFASQYNNIFVCGAYKESEKNDIVDSFDMICYNYPTSFVNYPALANKFYDGIIRKKPMFANSATFSGKLVCENGLGISLDENESDIADKIYDYYTSLDENKFLQNCEEYLSKVLEDEKKYTDTIEKIVKP